MTLFKSNSNNRPDIPTLIIFFLLHIAIFVLLFIPISQLFYYSPGAFELGVAKQILNGGIPYRDFTSEYPPLALLIYYIPALIQSGYPAYGFVFAAEMLFFDLIIVYLVADIATYIELPLVRTLTIYTIVLLAVGPIIVARFDLLPAVLVLAAVWAFIKGKNVLSWVIVALGVTAKLYPLVIAPALGFYLLRNREFRRLFTGVGAFTATMLACNLPFFLMNPTGFAGIITYHGDRGIQCESTYASIVLIGKALGLTDVTGVFNYGSWNIASPFADSLAKIALPLTAVFLLAMYGVYVWFLWKKTDKTPYLSTGIDIGHAKFIIGYVTLAVAIFMAGNKVFSPQFLIWLIPTMPLLNGKWQPVYTLIFVTMGLITQFIFPYKYTEYGSFQTAYVLILALRNFLLIFLGGLIMLTTGTKHVPEFAPAERVPVTVSERKAL